MESRLSPLKSAAHDARTIRTLLKHGAYITSPEPRVLETAKWLASLGVVKVHQANAVRCSNPADTDFPPTVRDCDGFIELRAGDDEGGGAYRCASCDRIVFPHVDEKAKIETLTIELRQQGIEALIIDRCGELAADRTFEDGRLTIPIQSLNANICLVDYCADQRWLRRSVGLGQAVIYITAEADRASRILRDDAVLHIALSDILLGAIDLQAFVLEKAGQDPSQSTLTDLPIYSLGARPLPPNRPSVKPGRRFRISISCDGVIVDGHLIVSVSSSTGYAIMRILIGRFVNAIAAGETPQPISAELLADAIQEDPESIQDPNSARRTIDRIRNKIVEVISQSTGDPVDTNDVIENVSRTGAVPQAQGYRLNPTTVNLTAAPPE